MAIEDELRERLRKVEALFFGARWWRKDYPASPTAATFSFFAEAIGSFEAPRVRWHGAGEWRPGWTSALLIACAVSGLLLIAAFIWREGKAPGPLIDLRPFRSRPSRPAASASLSPSLCRPDALDSPLVLRDETAARSRRRGDWAEDSANRGASGARSALSHVDSRGMLLTTGILRRWAKGDRAPQSGGHLGDRCSFTTS
jgi:hypothetical protein